MAATLAEFAAVALLLSFCHFDLTEAFELNFDSTEGILAIVGIAVGGLVILIILIACCCYCSKSDEKRSAPPPTNMVNSASSDKSHVIASTQFGPQAPYNTNNNVTQLSNPSSQRPERAASPPTQQSAAQARPTQLQPLAVVHPPTTVVQQQQPPTPAPVTPQPQVQQLPLSPQQQQPSRLSYTSQTTSIPGSMPQSPRTPETAGAPIYRPNSLLDRNQDRASGRLPKSIYKNPFGFPEDNFEDLLIVELKTKLPPKQPYLGQNYSVNTDPTLQRDSWQQDDRRARSQPPAGSYSPSLPRVQVQGHPNQVQSDYASDHY